MLFFQETSPSAEGAKQETGTSNLYTAQGALEQIKESLEAIQSFTLPVFNEQKLKSFVDEINKAAIAQESLSKSLQRSMGGVIQSVDASDEFAKNLKEAYYGDGGALELGMSLKETAEGVEGLAGGMGRMINPSSTVTKNMAQMAKATGQSSKEIGTMVANMTLYNFNQEEALTKMHEMAVSARSSGLSAKSYMAEINKNMKNISGFGFKAGVDGMSKMVKQAMLLRTNIESIGASKVQDSALDPEGAIELAANFQMLGGAVGKLADPFQLMYMAQNDVAGLQDELVKSTKAAMTFNQATGKFDVSTEDMYRLRQQAQLTGANLEDLVNTGRQAAKLDMLKDKFDLSGISEESKEMLAGLSEIGPGGTVTFDLPGFDEQGDTLADILKDSDRKAELEKELKEYQTMAGKSEKEIAIKELTIAETQAKDIMYIKEAVLKQLGDDGRKELETSIKELTKSTGESSKEYADASATITKGIPKAINTAAKTGVEAMPGISGAQQETIQDMVDIFKNKISQPIDPSSTGATGVFDAFFPATGEGPKIMSKGKLFQGIVGDEVAVGTNLSDALKSGGLGGKLDININVGGSVGGDSGTVAKMFEDPAVQKKIMDTVLYKLEMYKKQKGVLA